MSLESHTSKPLQHYLTFLFFYKENEIQSAFLLTYEIARAGILKPPKTDLLCLFYYFIIISPMRACVFSCSVVSDFLWPRGLAHQALLSMGFSMQEYWSGLPCLLPGDLSDQGIEPSSLALQADSLQSEPPGKPQISPIPNHKFGCFLCVSKIPKQSPKRSLKLSGNFAFEQIIDRATGFSVKGKISLQSSTGWFLDSTQRGVIGIIGGLPS